MVRCAAKKFGITDTSKVQSPFRPKDFEESCDRFGSQKLYILILAGPYIGLSGVAYSLLRVYRLNTPLKQYCIDTANELLHIQLTNEKKKIGSTLQKHDAQYLLGGLGLGVVAAIANIVQERSHDKFLEQLDRLVGLVAQDGLQGKGVGDDELLVGRAGFLAAILTLQ
jgi:hypothetical protein